jgi:hypothetical protein
MVDVAATIGHAISHRAHLRELADKVSKTNESLERATKAYDESRKLLAELRKPTRFNERPQQDDDHGARLQK